jgi:hypothetical protein
LYEIYEQSILDDDYVTATGKRKGNILNLNLEYFINNKSDERVKEFLAVPKFRVFLNDLMDTIFWGHSLFEFAFNKEDFDYYLIPRTNVNPERQVVLRNPADMIGVPYNTLEYKNTLLEVLDIEKFGLLRVVSIYTIYKRNMLGDWANYSELAGNNFRLVKYTGSDTNIRSRVLSALENAGSGGVVNLPDGVSVDFVNQSSSSANALFEGFHKRMSDAIIRLILGQTITTTDEQAAYARAKVAKEVEEDISTNDKMFVLNVLNFQFNDFMPKWGMPNTGEFRFVEEDKTPLNERLANDKILSEIVNMGAIPREVLEERYDIELEEEKEEPEPAPNPFIQPPEEEEEEEEEEVAAVFEIENPYPNEHAARLQSPNRFDKFRRTAGGVLFGKRVPKSVSIIWGHLKGRGDDDWTAQALRFNKRKWTADRARKWLQDNNIKYKSFEPAG